MMEYYNCSNKGHRDLVREEMSLTPGNFSFYFMFLHCNLFVLLIIYSMLLSC
jgi:hypothetical protein